MHTTRQEEISLTSQIISREIWQLPVIVILINLSQDESSEETLGEWLEERGVRDQIVLATKVRFWQIK